jgi:hypothetical protein
MKFKGQAALTSFLRKSSLNLKPSFVEMKSSFQKAKGMKKKAMATISLVTKKGRLMLTGLLCTYSIRV